LLNSFRGSLYFDVFSANTDPAPFEWNHMILLQL
jgi:hypothetical protein